MAVAPRGLEVKPVTGLPEVSPGDDLASQIIDSLERADLQLNATDVLVVAQKIVSKSEGAVVHLPSVDPGQEATALAAEVDKDPRLVELILSQSKRIVRSVPGVLITETHHGLICANAGIDASNTADPDTVILLPDDPDRSAHSLRESLFALTAVRCGVVVSDSFNRPWRQGSVNVAIGTAGFTPLDDIRGQADDAGRTLWSTIVSIADEVASAAQLVMGEAGGVPAALVRGLEVNASDTGSESLLRDPDRDLFR